MNSSNASVNPYAEQSFSQTLFLNVSRLWLGMCAMLGNGLILYTIARNQSIRRNLCNLLIGLLAFTDFVTGFGIFLFCYAVLSFQLIPWYNYTTGQCLIVLYFEIVGIQMSQIATIFIAFDRRIAVRDLMLYSMQDRIRQFSLALSVTVIYSLFAASIMFVGIDFNSFPSPVFCNAGSVIHQYFIIYWNIFSVVVAILVIVCYVTTSRLLTKKLTSIKSERLNRELSKQQSVFKTIRIVLLVYGVCWCLPNMIDLFATIIGVSPVLLGHLTTILGVGASVSMNVNVFIYALKHLELGPAMRKVLSKTTAIKPIQSVPLRFNK